MAATLLPADPPPVAPGLPPAQSARLWKAARDFEAMTLGELLKPMFDTVDTAHGLFGGGDGEAAFKPMLISEIAKQLAAHGGLGLARPVFAAMLRAQEAHGTGGGTGTGTGTGTGAGTGTQARTMPQPAPQPAPQTAPRAGQ
jgi:flagellar protein FlgJ